MTTLTIEEQEAYGIIEEPEPNEAFHVEEALPWGDDEEEPEFIHADCGEHVTRCLCWE